MTPSEEDKAEAEHMARYYRLDAPDAEGGSRLLRALARFLRAWPSLARASADAIRLSGELPDFDEGTATEQAREDFVEGVREGAGHAFDGMSDEQVAEVFERKGTQVEAATRAAREKAQQAGLN